MINSRMSTPRVSFLIVTFRSYRELASCLSSLHPFLTDDIEVIVVDHESRQDEAAAIRSRFPWVNLLATTGNPGFAAGVNRAAQLAAGDFLLLLNPDCVVRQDVAHSLAAFLQSHPSAAVCGPLIREADGRIQYSARRFPGVSTGFAGRTSWLTRTWPDNPWTRANLRTSTTATEPLEVDWVSGACLMIRRAVFQQVGGMDEKFFMYWEDADLCLRVHRRGWTVFYVSTVEITHLTARSSGHAPVASLVAFHRSAFRYFVKHGGVVARAMAPFVYVLLGTRLVMKLALEHGRFRHR